MDLANRYATRHGARRSNGFTMVEVLVVVGILLLLIGIVLPSLWIARESARCADCSSRMRQVALSVKAYSTANGDAIPVGIYRTSRHTGQTLVIPHIEASSLFKRGFGNGVTENGTTAANSPGRLTRLPIFICPSDNPSETGMPNGETSRFARSNFVLCFGSDATLNLSVLQGVFRFNAASSFAEMATDGTSNTTMISEVIAGKTAADVAGMWAYGGGGSSAYTNALPPTNIFFAADSVTGSAADLAGAKGRASSNHPGLVNVVFGDLHAAQVATSIDPATWVASGTASGGEVYGCEPCEN